PQRCVCFTKRLAAKQGSPKGDRRVRRRCWERSKRKEGNQRRALPRQELRDWTISVFDLLEGQGARREFGRRVVERSEKSLEICAFVRVTFVTCQRWAW